MFGGSKRQEAEDPGWEDSSISSRTKSIPFATLAEYIEHLSRSFRIPAGVTTQFNQNVMALAMGCYPGQQGLSTTLSGTLDDKTSFYTVLHIMQNDTGFTVTHSHHTVTTERGQVFSHDANYLESSALNDLEKLGVKGARDLYKGNKVLDQPEHSSGGAANSHFKVLMHFVSKIERKKENTNLARHTMPWSLKTHQRRTVR